MYDQMFLKGESCSNSGGKMAKFTQEQCNFALLFLYVGEKGPKVLKKYVIDKLFTYQLLKTEVHLRETLDSSKISLIFPNDEPVSSLDKLDDAEVFDVSTLVFNKTDDLKDIQGLRSQIYAQLEGPIFCEFMKVKEEQFRKKINRNKLFGKQQMDTLFPPGDSININKLDITLFSFILFEGFNYLKPVTDLNKFPVDNDISPGSDILRIKLCRNSMAHNTDTEISEEDFGRLWECMTQAFERLTGDATYRQEGNRLKCERPQINTMNQLRSILETWRKDDRDERIEHLDHITKVMMSKREKNKKRRKPSGKLVAVYIKDFKKFKAVCKGQGIKYKIQVSYSTESTITSSSTSSSTSSISSLVQFSCDEDQEILLPQITVRSASRQRRGYVFNERDEEECLRVISGRYYDEGTEINCCEDLEFANGKRANILQLKDVEAFEYHQDNSKCTLEVLQSSGITGGEDDFFDLLPQYECNAPEETGSTWSLCNVNIEQHVQAQSLDMSNRNELTNLSEDQWTSQPQINVESKSRLRRGYVFNEKDMEAFRSAMPERTYDAETDNACCRDMAPHHPGMVPYAAMSLSSGTNSQPKSYYTSKLASRSLANANTKREEADKNLVPYTGTSVYSGANSESSGYYTSEFAASTSAYGITERKAANRDFVPYTATSVYSEANSESTGYYSSELVASRSGHAISEREAANEDLYSYADNVLLSRTTEDGCYSADYANDPGNSVYSVPLVQTEEMEEKKSSGLKALQRSHEDTITSISMATSSELDIEQRKTRHRRKSKSKWEKIYNRLRGGVFLKCIPFKNQEQEICEPMMNTRCKILADKETTPLQRKYDRRNSQTNSETNQYAELFLEEPYAETNIL